MRCGAVPTMEALASEHTSRGEGKPVGSVPYYSGSADHRYVDQRVIHCMTHLPRGPIGFISLANEHSAVPESTA
jgi:hypothetical protein